MKIGVLKGEIPYGIADSGASSTVGQINDPFDETNKKSNKIFQMPTGNLAPASEVKHLKHDVRDPAKEVHIVPKVTTNTLISTGKFADANYITIFDKDEVNVYDANDTKITVK